MRFNISLKPLIVVNVPIFLNGSVKGTDFSEVPVIRFNNSSSPSFKSLAILFTFLTNSSKSPLTIVAILFTSNSIETFRLPLTSTYMSLANSVVSVNCSIVRLFVFKDCNTRLTICCFSDSVIIQQLKVYNYLHPKLVDKNSLQFFLY